ncbi:hypothetical protein ACFQX6_57140 [Streptosporangium lutulentum]
MADLPGGRERRDGSGGPLGDLRRRMGADLLRDRVALRIEETHMDQRPMEQEKLSESYNEGRMPSRAGV